MSNFYSSGVQGIAEELVANDASNRVAFVTKDGTFPGEDQQTGTANFLRITEANAQASYATTSDRLVSMQRGLALDPATAGAQQVAIGHSWGLTNITGAETFGAQYDDVVSLSGAWMPKDWQPDPSTEYRDYSYDDILQDAQLLQLVGDGNTPCATGSPFDHDGYYE